MKPLSVIFLLFSCVIAGLSGAILYNYVTLHAAKKQLSALEADMVTYNKLMAEQEQKERAEVDRRQVRPSKMISSGSSLLTEKQHYLAQIIAKIQQNWVVDDTMRGNECRINIKLSPDGSVAGTKVLGGDYGLCMSSINAVKKSGSFPMSKDPAVYDLLKDITVILKPELR